MILPLAVDQHIAAGDAFTVKARFFEYADGSQVTWHNAGFDPVELQLGKRIVNH
ncbi:hypothetical protein J43TS9_35060 [Paenibacillus cineris]|nr:hypothetical protein J43TS9_35060 [Paenibacillus cineris]